MSRHTRRTFLKTSLAAGAAFTIAGTKSSGKVLGANDTIRIGVAGINGRGGSHIEEFAGMKGVQVTYLIDPDSRLFKTRTSQVEKLGKNTPKTVQDIRQALEDKNLDAISVATCNHWHSLATILACQAGKDVYVEKPLSHNIHEGRIAVETARKNNCIVQHGTQGRSSMGMARVVEVIKSGQLGKLLVARGLCYKGRGSIGFKEAKAPPKELDFNIWLGPSPLQPYHENLVHYNWHWFWNTGNGDIGNQGVHEMDKARWGIPGATLPKSVVSLGGRFGYKDQGETPNTQIAIFDYGETQLIFEVRGLKTKPYGELGGGVGNSYHLEAGTIYDETFYPKGSGKPAPLPKVKATRGPGGGHFANFIVAVRSRKREELNAEVLEGHYSAAHCHLANISYRLGEKVTFDPKTKFADNKDACDALARAEEHLKDNRVQLEGLEYTLGRKLTFDAAAEKFVGDEEANKLLTRPARPPFVVPEKVS
ncbi:MAG: Gfo/Idh/MocA family oxidoreductase [Pirellulales bacterium]